MLCRFRGGLICQTYRKRGLTSHSSSSFEITEFLIQNRQRPKIGDNYIIENATVVSADREIGNFPNCDVLIENGFISAVGPNLQHYSEHTVIEGTNSIASPGFTDTYPEWAISK